MIITIDALTPDGYNVLARFDGRSPTGGLATTRQAKRTELLPGDVIRQCGTWVVIIDIHHDGVHGLTTIVAVDRTGRPSRRTLAMHDGAEVRTDARIDTDTLWKLVR